MRSILQLQNMKRQDHFDKLIDDVFDNKPIFDANPKIEDVFIGDDHLFDESDEQETKYISNNIINNTHTNEVLFEDLPEPKLVVQNKISKKMSNKITQNKNLERIAKKIKDKYKKQQQKKKKKPIRKAGKKAINRMKKSNYLQPDNDKRVDYNNDASLDDLETIDYNSDIEIELTTAPKISTT